MGMRRGTAGRFGLALGLGVLLGLGAAAAGLADGPATGPGRVDRVAQKAAKKKAAKSKKGMTPKAMEPESPTEKPEKTESASADDKTLKFSRDIAPVLVGNCIGCHNPEGNNAKAAVLNLTTFQGIMAGTPKRKVVIPGKPDESPLLLRVRNEETPKMPPGNQRNLADETLDKIEAWIKAGALLDRGKDPAAPIKSYALTPEAALRAELAKLSPAERDKRVEAAAQVRLKKVNPEGTPETTPGAHFLLFSNLPQERAEALVKVMETQYAVLHKFLNPPGVPALDGPLKISIYVFNDPNFFVELARTLENRELDPNTVTTGNLNNETPYLAAVDPLGGRDEPQATKKAGKSKRAEESSAGGAERTLAGLLTEQFATSALLAAKDSKAPRWLSLGVGAYFGSRVEPHSVYYRHLRGEAYTQYLTGWGEKSKEVLGDATDTDKLRALGFTLAEWLGKAQAKQFPLFVRGMLEGSEKLDAGLQGLWGMKRDEFLAAWGEWIAANYRKAR